MSKVTVYVGLDYHKDSIQVCIMDHTGKILANRPCPNQATAVVSTVAAHGQDVRAAIEACSGSANLADELATQHGWIINLAHPGYVARMKQTPDKTDWADARVIADLVRVGYLPKVWLAPEDVRQLRALTRYRQQLVKDRTAAKLRVTALLREHRVAQPASKRWTKAWMTWLAVVAQLLKLPGVGRVTAWVLRAEIGRFDRFGTGKQMARYCGLSPRNASSGQRQADAGLIKAGNEHLRATIIEAAHRLIRYDSRWKALAATLRRAGKPACVIAAAIGNRWIRWLFHQVAGGPITLKKVA
jgi:transposase